MKYPTVLTLAGYLLISVAFSLIGPAPFIRDSLPNSVGLSYCVALMIGSSYSLVVISAFARVTRAARVLGYCDDMNTNLNLASECNLYEGKRKLFTDRV